MSTVQTVVTGVGLALPGGPADPGALLRAVAAAGETPGGPAAEPLAPVDPAALIGRKGLRYKDRSTQLALAAAAAGLRDAGLIPADGERLTEPATSVGVVASSNLGNLDTVCQVADEIARESVQHISPMGLPNASSNVVASTIAIRFGLRGPNVMLCNGATSGLDALHWAANLVAAGRLRRALVVGVETHNEVVRKLLGQGPEDLLDGAVALVLESAADARARGARPLAALGGYHREAGLAACLKAVLAETDTAPGVWFTPERHPEPRAAASDPVPAGVARHDVSRRYGRASGAHGVLQCAAAVGWLDARRSAAPGSAPTALLTSGDDTTDGVAGLLVTAPTGESA
ncbi:beta-ketoacyl synthase N-terminal-like domain-containing protein [Streptomyces sp. SAJ15]|uniref:beta-ketoacyl synthase N-terminal-like domain-containing protein n=1 Tax=Streptomyces sp. SAJ15 TaxID=2011095 RepID=UPI00118588EF|nr:beta-ketoacyl synthase N-terminal-like domain-containing protein [Streptomyces sp. SAJ15]TVL89232.1 beta-ketoacyl synthase [Streptomyces sp. SAJ15]